MQKISLAYWSHLCEINEPAVRDLWTTFNNPVIFRCDAANSSKSTDFNKQWDFSLQHNLYNV